MALTETVWQGSNDNFAAAANWTNGIPGTTAADLNAVFDDRSQHSPQSNLDQSAATYNFTVTRTPGYLGQIGSAGNPLKYKGITDGRGATLLGIQGDTYLWLADENSDVCIDAGRGHVSLDGTVYGLMIRSGRVTVLRTCALATQCVVQGVTANLTIEQYATSEASPNWMVLDAGTILNKRDYPGATGRIAANAGTWTQEGLITTETSIAVHGAEFIYDPSSDPSGEGPNLIALSGIVDFSRYPGSIPMGRVIKGRNVVFYGTVSEAVSAWADYDFGDDYFYP